MSSTTLILLNGTSSSGKTSLASALQEILPSPYMGFSSDILDQYIHPRFQATWEAKRAFLPALLQGHFHCMKALVKTGNWVVADVVLEEKILVAEAAKALWDQRAYLIGVHCNAEELKRREGQRGDRALGMAIGQLDKVHAHDSYDFEVDTTATDPTTCAAQIAAFLAEDPVPHALAGLKKAWQLDLEDPSFELDWWEA